MQASDSYVISVLLKILAIQFGYVMSNGQWETGNDMPMTLQISKKSTLITHVFAPFFSFSTPYILMALFRFQTAFDIITTVREHYDIGLLEPYIFKNFYSSWILVRLPSSHANPSAFHSNQNCLTYSKHLADL